MTELSVRANFARGLIAIMVLACSASISHAQPLWRMTAWEFNSGGSSCEQTDYGHQGAVSCVGAGTCFNGEYHPSVHAGATWSSCVGTITATAEGYAVYQFDEDDNSYPFGLYAYCKATSSLYGDFISDLYQDCSGGNEVTGGPITDC